MASIQEHLVQEKAVYFSKIQHKTFIKGKCDFYNLWKMQTKI